MEGRRLHTAGSAVQGPRRPGSERRHRSHSSRPHAHPSCQHTQRPSCQHARARPPGCVPAHTRSPEDPAPEATRPGLTRAHSLFLARLALVNESGPPHVLALLSSRGRRNRGETERRLCKQLTRQISSSSLSLTSVSRLAVHRHSLTHTQAHTSMADCVFCGIASGAEAARVVKSDDLLVVFHDISPHSDVHLLIIPKVS